MVLEFLLGCRGRVVLPALALTGFVDIVFVLIVRTFVFVVSVTALTANGIVIRVQGAVASVVAMKLNRVGIEKT